MNQFPMNQSPKPPLDYRRGDDDDQASPQVRWQTIVSCSLLGMALCCGLAALAWPSRRHELVAGAITLAIGGVIIYFPYVRT
jgi:hypothetical protein